MLAMEPRVVDALWAAVGPRIPEREQPVHPLGCRRPRIPDREVFEAILFRLVTGCSWDVAGRLGRGSETTLRTRYNEWNAHGVFDEVAQEAIEGYDRVVGVDLSEASVDASLHKAPCGGDGAGKSPVDRGKSGWKWSLLCDRAGIPVGWTADAANRNDCTLLEPTLADAQRRGLLADVETLHLDRGYAGNPVLRQLRHPRHRAQPQTPTRQHPPQAQGRTAGQALDHRTHQLVAVQLRTTAPQHRPQPRSPPRTTRTRRRPNHHRQTLQMGRPMEPHLAAYSRTLLVHANPR